MNYFACYLEYQDSYLPVSWVRVRVRIRVRFRVCVIVFARGRVYDRMYVIGGKCPRTAN